MERKKQNRDKKTLEDLIEFSHSKNSLNLNYSKVKIASPVVASERKQSRA
jgi:hypothetical protein